MSLNNTSSFQPEYERLQYEYMLLSFMPAATICGNSLIVLAVLTQKSLKAASNYLLLSLAMSDLAIGLFVMPFSIYTMINNQQWSLPYSMCRLYMVADVSCSTASISNLVAISVDRFYAVVRHLEYRSRKHDQQVYGLIGLVWGFSIALGLILGTSLMSPSDAGFCGIADTDFMLYGSICTFYIPSGLMLAMYGVVFARLHQQLKALAKPKQKYKLITEGLHQTTRFERLIALGKSRKQRIHSGNKRNGTKAEDQTNCFVTNTTTQLSATGNGACNGLSPINDSPLPAQAMSPGELDPAPLSDTRFKVLPELMSLLPKRLRRRRQPHLHNNQRHCEIAGNGLPAIPEARRPNQPVPNSSAGKTVRKETRATKLVAAVLVVFLACWTPFFTVNLIVCYYLRTAPENGISSTLDRAFTICAWLGYLNSCLNPFIYALINQRFRHAFQTILRIRPKGAHGRPTPGHGKGGAARARARKISGAGCSTTVATAYKRPAIEDRVPEDSESAEDDGGTEPKVQETEKTGNIANSSHISPHGYSENHTPLSRDTNKFLTLSDLNDSSSRSKSYSASQVTPSKTRPKNMPKLLDPNQAGASWTRNQRSFSRRVTDMARRSIRGNILKLSKRHSTTNQMDNFGTKYIASNGIKMPDDATYYLRFQTRQKSNRESTIEQESITEIDISVIEPHPDDIIL